MATLNDWVEGARIRTLPAAVAPVLLGVGAAVRLGSFSAGKSLLALLVALALQVGVNYANDYSDGIKGSDQDRVGPPRLTGGGLAKPSHVLRAALVSFAVAAVCGLVLVAWSQLWWLLLVGALAVLAAWFYTGGKHPYGYAGVGLSELLVFVFFGLTATIGTTYVQAYSAPLWLWVAASGIGFASVALLMVNNVRDMFSDEQVGKRTVAVRMGPTVARGSVAVLFGWSAALGGIASWGAGIAGPWAFAIAAILALASVPAVAPVLMGSSGRGLLGALRASGLYALTYGVLIGSIFALAPAT